MSVSIDSIRNVIKETKIPPKNLELEITEYSFAESMETTIYNIEQLRDMNIHIALDDFGTGYSSLNHIKSMPLDVIKIDRCFVNGVGTDAFSDAFVKTVSKLADAIDVNVCVEGVEEERQREALDDMNIQMIQGFLYDRPLTQDEFERKYLV